MAHKDAKQILDSLVVFCPLHGWGASVYGQPIGDYRGPATPWEVITTGGTARCNGDYSGGYCGRELVLGTFDAVGECTLDERLRDLPVNPSL